MKMRFAFTRGTLLAGLITVCVLSGFTGSGQRLQAAEARPQPEKEICARQLRTIYDAIQAYRRDHKELPNWMSDLVPKYLPDKSVLVCPVTRRTGQAYTYGINDPNATTSYIFEFCAQVMPADIWGGGEGGITMRQFKQMQMALVGGDVPILRCHQHAPVLNLSFDGKLYESDATWENRFTSVVNFDDFQPARLRERFQMAPATTKATPPATQGIPAARVESPTPPVEREEPPHPMLGKPAPALQLDLLAGGAFDLAEHKGKELVILDFWATWCPPCRQALPVLMDIARQYEDKGVRYLAVDLRETPDTIKKYLEQAKLNPAVPLDRKGEAGRQYQVSAIPTLFVVDKEGVIRWVHVGYTPELKAKLSKVLDGLLAGNQ